MEKKIGVYICGGCGISDSVDVEKLADMAKKEYKVPALVHPFLCSAEGIAQMRNEMAEGGINGLVIAACSPRAKD